MSPQEELTVRLRQQALLAEIGRRALTSLSFVDLLEEACRLTALGLEVQFCKVLEFLPGENELLVRAGVGWREGVVGHAKIGADLDSPAGYALHTGRPVISNRLSDEHRFNKPDLLREHNIERAANVILLGDGRPFGVLEADSQNDGAFTEHDIDFLQAVANLLGIALERRRAETELRELNSTLEQRVRDEVAERRQAEDALRQAQKMEAIGQLTGGVAHDFNNLLMVMIGNLNLLAKDLAEHPKHGRLIAAAQKAAGRGAQLTRQLLAFARRQTLRPESRPINELVREFDVLTSRVLGDAIRIDFQLDPFAGACDVDPAQFGSALLNLAINARDAMPSGGDVVIRTANLTVDRAGAARLATAPGKYVVLEVADTGTGMTPDVLERALEPFFTTKGPGMGTGLGLSQVHGFVRQSEGFVTLESPVEGGTKIVIGLPRSEAKTAQEVTEEEPDPNASGTILLVEDDADVRELVLLQLQELGYRTLSAANGPEALQILRDPQVRVEAMLTDLIMPGGMSGLDLVRAAREARPGLPVVLASGYASGAATAAAAQEQNVPTLSKPYQSEQLGRALAQALGEAGEPQGNRQVSNSP